MIGGGIEPRTEGTDMNLNQNPTGAGLTNGAVDKKLGRSLRRIERKLDLLLAHLGYEEVSDKPAAEIYEALKRNKPGARRARVES